MDIDVTTLFREGSAINYSASAAEIGQDAGRVTWQAALERAAEPPAMLDTPDKIDAMRDHLRGYGAWEDTEVAAWSAAELEAFLIQEVSATMREGGLDGQGRRQWAAYYRMAREGRIRGNLYQHKGRVFYTIGS